MNFSEAVKAAMDANGVTKSALSKSMGCSYQHVHDLLSGERRWNEDTINKACAALGIQVTFEQKEDQAGECNPSEATSNQ